DPGAKGNGVWFSYTKIDGPELPVIPLPALMPDVAEIIPPENNQISVPTPTNKPVMNDQPDGPPTVPSPGSVLAITSVTVALFLVLILGSVFWKRSS
ncbi:MAG: hypothetical protein AB1798_09590, partial [Spirochaetota bacterium]